MFQKLGMIILLLLISLIIWARGTSESFQNYIPLSIKEKADPQWLSQYEQQLKNLSLDSQTSSYALLLTRDLLALEENFPVNPKEAARIFHNIAKKSDLMLKKGESVIKTTIKSHSNWIETKAHLKDNLHSWGKASTDFILNELAPQELRRLAFNSPDLTKEYPDLAKHIEKESARAEKAAAKAERRSSKSVDKADKANAKDEKATAKTEKKDEKSTAKDDKKDNKDNKKVKEK